MIDIAAEQAEAVVQQISDEGGQAAFMLADVANDLAINEAVEAAIARWGRLDYGVNVAGTATGFGLFCDSAEIRQSIDVNLYGTIFALRAEALAMRRLGIKGAIVNCASTASEIGSGDLPYYATTKHGVAGFTKSAAIALARDGIRVNAVQPGFIRTPMTEGFFGSEIETIGLSMTQMDRIGEPADIAAAVWWLCTEESSYVTGSLLTVDGGFLAGPKPWQA